MFMKARAQFMREARSRHRARSAQGRATSGLKLCVRLNGATDINWIAVIKQYPTIQFVDYTKSEARAIAHAARASFPPTTTSRSHSPAITTMHASEC